MALYFPAHPCGRPVSEGVLGSCLWPGLGPDGASTLGMSQGSEDWFLCFCLSDKQIHWGREDRAEVERSKGPVIWRSCSAGWACWPQCRGGGCWQDSWRQAAEVQCCATVS